MTNDELLARVAEFWILFEKIKEDGFFSGVQWSITNESPSPDFPEYCNVDLCGIILGEGCSNRRRIPVDGFVEDLMRKLEKYRLGDVYFKSESVDLKSDNVRGREIKLLLTLECYKS
ncbi:hypothetical protein ACFL2R_01615 [Patescibacteria group bacterium]